MSRIRAFWPRERRRSDERSGDGAPGASAATKLLLFAGTFLPALLATLALAAYRRRRRRAATGHS